MRRRGIVAAGTLATAIALTMAPAGAAAAQGPPEGVRVVDVDQDRDDDPYGFDLGDAQLPPLRLDAVTAAEEDELQLRFLAPSDLGGFQSAPLGGTTWAGEGVPLVGVDAPAVADGEPLDTTTSTGGGSTGTTAIPQVDGTDGEDGRSTFAFTDEDGEPTAPPEDLPPQDPAPTEPSEGTEPPPPETLATTTTTTPPTTGGDGDPAPAPAPSTTATTTARPTSTTATTTARPTSTTTATVPTTTSTTAPRTTTTARPRTTTTPAPTTTTTAPPTTTTTTPPPSGTFELTEERPAANACVATSSSASVDCDALWDVGLAREGQVETFDLTLRNSGDVDADALQLWANVACTTTSTGSPSGNGDLCGAIEMTIQRYTSAARDVPLECVYGGGTAQVCSLHPSRDLAHFSSTYPSSSAPRAIGTGLDSGEACYLRITLSLPSTTNDMQRRQASISLRWRQLQ